MYSQKTHKAMREKREFDQAVTRDQAVRKAQQVQKTVQNDKINNFPEYRISGIRKSVNGGNRYSNDFDQNLSQLMSTPTYYEKKETGIYKMLVFQINSYQRKLQNVSQMRLDTIHSHCLKPVAQRASRKSGFILNSKRVGENLWNSTLVESKPPQQGLKNDPKENNLKQLKLGPGFEIQAKRRAENAQYLARLLRHKNTKPSEEKIPLVRDKFDDFNLGRKRVKPNGGGSYGLNIETYTDKLDDIEEVKEKLTQEIKLEVSNFFKQEVRSLFFDQFKKEIAEEIKDTIVNLPAIQIQSQRLSNESDKVVNTKDESKQEETQKVEPQPVEPKMEAKKDEKLILEPVDEVSGEEDQSEPITEENKVPTQAEKSLKQKQGAEPLKVQKITATNNDSPLSFCKLKKAKSVEQLIPKQPINESFLSKTQPSKEREDPAKKAEEEAKDPVKKAEPEPIQIQPVVNQVVEEKKPVQKQVEKTAVPIVAAQPTTGFFSNFTKEVGKPVEGKPAIANTGSFFSKPENALKPVPISENSASPTPQNTQASNAQINQSQPKKVDNPFLTFKNNAKPSTLNNSTANVEGTSFFQKNEGSKNFFEKKEAIPKKNTVQGNSFFGSNGQTNNAQQQQPKNESRNPFADYRSENDGKSTTFANTSRNTFNNNENRRESSGSTLNNLIGNSTTAFFGGSNTGGQDNGRFGGASQNNNRFGGLRDTSRNSRFNGFGTGRDVSSRNNDSNRNNAGFFKGDTSRNRQDSNRSNTNNFFGNSGNNNSRDNNSGGFGRNTNNDRGRGSSSFGGGFSNNNRGSNGSTLFGPRSKNNNRSGNGFGGGFLNGNGNRNSGSNGGGSSNPFMGALKKSNNNDGSSLFENNDRPAPQRRKIKRITRRER